MDDLDVDDEILRLTGDVPAKPKRAPAKKPAKRRRRHSSDESDDPSEEEEEEEEQSYISEEDAGRSSEEEDDEDILDEYGPDLYGDEEDRKWLASMPEVEREQILNERAEKRQTALERLEIRKLLKEGKRDESKRRSARGHEKPRSEKAKGLSELKRRREQKSAKTSSGRGRSHSPEGVRRRRNASYSAESASEEESDHAEAHAHAKRVPTLEEMNTVRLARHELDKWVHSPFFENTVIGCFVKLSIGVDQDTKANVYRIAEIKDVVTYHKVYRIDKQFTNKALQLAHGKAVKTFTMDMVSNSPFTETELGRYFKTLRFEQVRLPNMERIQEKLEDIKAARQYVLTDEEVNAIIKAKKDLTQGVANRAVERTKLQNEREKAKQHGDAQMLAEIEHKLASLDATESRSEDVAQNKLDKWAELNRKNRERNQRELREAERLANEARKKKQALGAQDPSARVRTAPKMVHDPMHTPQLSTPNSAGTPTPGTPTLSQKAGVSAKELDSALKVTAQSSALGKTRPMSRFEEMVSGVDLDIQFSDEDSHGQCDQILHQSTLTLTNGSKRNQNRTLRNLFDLHLLQRHARNKVNECVGARFIHADKAFATATGQTEPTKPPTAVLLTNMGGPSTLDQVGDFLSRLFHDSDLMQLPLQKYSARWIAKRRTPQIVDQYDQIGGGSPILHWTRKQGETLEKLLDERCPETAPHKHYVAFRYALPLTEDALKEMKADGVKRAIVFSQYPQYSCSTTGSSLNELVRKAESMDPNNDIQWSVIDRWPTHPGLVDAFARHIERTLLEYSPEERKDVVILFSAHSLPMSVVNRGDPYPAEVGATVYNVMQRLNFSNPYRLVWQSQVGPAAWLGPQTKDALKGYAEKGKKNLLLVPIAFTSDHIETLFELDKEYGHQAKELGITGYKRAESLNDDPVFIEAMADVVKKHLEDGKAVSAQLLLRCPSCTNDMCATTRQFFVKQKE